MSTHVVLLHPILRKVVKPLSQKESKTKEERLLEMYIKDYITDTQYFKMLERIKKEK